jgi:uncharacterized protein involved in exopolysaccharide biosynthesis
MAAPDPPNDAQHVEVVNFRAVHDWLLFGARAVRRHKWRALAVTASIVALAAIGLAVFPKKYQVECRLLAQKNQVLAVAGDAQSGEGLTRAATDVILRQENLNSLVRETNLVQEWPRRRAPIQRVRDWVTALAGAEPTNDERAEALVGYLQQQLKVWTEEGTVTIQIMWPDPQMAYRLVDAAQRNFLETRHVQEITTIAEAAAILEGHAADLRHDIDAALQDIQALRTRRRDDHAAAAASAAPAPPSTPTSVASPLAAHDPSSDRRLTELRVLIDAKQKALDQLEAFRQQRVSQLQTKLEEQRGVYTDEHPVVSDMKQALQAASGESSQARQLRGELSRLNKDFAALSAVGPSDLGKKDSARNERRLAPFASAKGLPSDALNIEQQLSDDRDPEVELARSKLRFAVENFQSLQDRLQKTRIDLDTAEAAFKYRYTVVTPPEVPHGPMSPKSGMILAVALVGGIVLGLLTAFVTDLRRGTLYERWQVESALKLPVLTDIRLLPRGPDKPV